MTSNLIEFVERALARGVERDEITQVLSTAGWPPDEVAAALGMFAKIDFLLPVPKPKQQVTAREAFTQLLFFSSLYVCIWAFVSVTFTFIDHFLPDPLERGDLFNAIRLEISTLIVFFPFFLFMFRLDSRNTADTTRRASRVRQWFVYLTLFIAAMTFACDVSTLVYRLLGGEYTTHFLLKVLIIALVASGIFAYFLHEMRQQEQK